MSAVDGFTLVSVNEELSPDFEHLFDCYHQALLVVDRDHVIRWINRAGIRLLKTQRDAAVGRSLSDFLQIDATVFHVLDPDARMVLQEPCPLCSDDDHIHRIERTRLDDASTLLRLRPIEEASLGNSSSLFASVVANLTEHALFTMFSDGRIASWNTGAERIMGWQADDVLLQPFDLIFTQEDRDRGVPQQERERALAVGRAEDKRWHMREDGSRFWANGILLRLPSAGNDSHRLLKILHDETDAQQRLLDLERSADEVERFSASLAHDLRRPLSTAGITLELILDRWSSDLDPKAQDLLEKSALGLAEVNGLVTSVLNFERGQQGQWHPEEIDLTALMQGIAREFDTDFKHANGRLDVMNLPIISCDRGILTLIFHNLIDNALKYGGPRPQVTVGAEAAEQGWWTVTVTDDGEGVAEDRRASIFEPYQRQRDTTIQGLGLGLSNCKKFVEGWGGRIWVEDAPGGGAAFRFTVPATPPES